MKSLCLAVVLAAFFLAMYAPPLSEAGWTCSNKGPCHCKDSNFSIEIESVVNEFFLKKNISDSEGKYSFLVSPCKPISCNLTNPNEDKTASACQFGRDTTKLGEVDQYSWNVENSTSFSITYKGGAPIDGPPAGSRQTRFDFTVAKVDKATIDYVTENKDDSNVHTYIFAATISPSEENQGGGSPSKAGAIGLVIIVLLLLGLLLYFIIGSIVMFQVKGARGSEVIPNQGFWKELPFLIRDGCKFTVSPCLKLSGKGYQSL